MNARAEEIIRSHGAIPTFLGYPHTGKNDFPASICTSINEELVHGIPSQRRWLEPGDIISVDVGAIYHGWVGDSAWTYAVGAIDEESQRLLEATEGALWAGIAQARPGNRLADISAAVEAYVVERGFAVVREYTGHGVGRKMHEDPQVLNYVPPKGGTRSTPGAGDDIGARADGQRGHLAHAYLERWVDRRDGGWQAVRSLRALDRRHRG